MLEHAYVRLQLKALETGPTRRISGLASTPSVDRQGHVLDPRGATFQNPLPLLLYHDKERPIGTARLTASAAGLAFEAELATVDEDGPLKARLAETWQLIRSGLLSAVSVGFRVLEGGVKALENGAVLLTKTEICELSLVTIPANIEARILATKSLAPSLAAFGLYLPGVSGATVKVPIMTKQTIAEQIASHETTRSHKSARMVELMEKAANEGTTLDAVSSQEYDTLSAEVASINTHVDRLKGLEALNLEQAKPISSKQYGNPHAPAVPVIRVRSQLPPGTAFIRYVQAMLVTKGDLSRAANYAQAQWHDSTPEVELALKAAVAAGTTTDATWAAPLVTLKPLSDEFIELLRPATVIGRIPGLSRVPFNVSVPSQTGGGTYGWVGQGAPKPVGKLQFGTITLGVTKCAGIIVITEELARTSTPSAEAVIRRDMINGIAAFLDNAFVDPTKAAVANVSPASITNGVTPITSAGTSGANARTDLQAMLAAMTAANISARGAVLLMSESNALALAGSLNPLGQPLFPGLDATGGTARGITVVTSQTLGSNNILLAPDCVLLADDGGVTIDVSREASLQMDSAPAAVPDATTVYTSLWQMNLVGLRAERFINWVKTRAGCVQTVVQTYIA